MPFMKFMIAAVRVAWAAPCPAWDSGLDCRAECSTGAGRRQ